jgi:hypothetical protein
MLYIVIGQIAVFAFDYLFASQLMSLSGWLVFDRALILQGQVWRVFSFVFVPLQSSPIFMLIYLYFIYSISRSVEREWGGFFFNIFYFLGVLGTIIGGFIAGGTSIEFINLSVFLAFALMAPNATFLLFFIIPIKAKYLAIVEVIILGLAFITGSLSIKIAILVSLINIAIFFWNDFYPKVRDKFRYRKIRHTFNREMRR